VLRTRLWTAAVALPLLLGIILWAPPRLFIIFIAILTAIALYEIAAMTHARGAALTMLIALGVAAALPLFLPAQQRPPITAVIILASLGLYGFASMIRTRGLTLLALLIIGLIASTPTLSLSRRFFPLEAAAVTLAMAILTLRVGLDGPASLGVSPLLIVLGTLWVAALFPYFALLSSFPGGVSAILLMVLLVILSDSGAYFAGRSLGRHKLLARVSPNKTVEGAIGGLAAVLLGAVIVRPWLIPQLSIRAALTLAIGIGLLAQIGDLANSAFKRIAGVKDSGWIFPGHGGLMDRACSLLFASAFTFYFLFPPPT
jgi:phosphatidate cytidylyltransferase